MSSGENLVWQAVCDSSELMPNIGVRALLGDEQVALFKVKDEYFAVSAIDPFTKAAVMSRGIVGDLKGKVVVASPIYKQHFELSTGACLEDQSVNLKTYPVRVVNGQLEVALQ